MTIAQLKYAVCVADKKSMNKAAGELFISQPSLSNAVKELEEELGFCIFARNNRGIVITTEGQEFLSYARQITEQYSIMEEQFVYKKKTKKKFSVSMQHYSFAVSAFIEMAKKFGMDQYEFAVHEAKTYEVIEDVKNRKSEIGILYTNDFNRKAMNKIFKENDLEFIELFDCDIYAYVWKNNPLASKERVTFDDLKDYPCLSFEQGKNNSFYFAEEVYSTYDYKQIIKANDRATMLNLMVGLNGYTLCSGMICEELNGGDYTAVPFDVDDKMTIGYIKCNGTSLSVLGKQYIEELYAYRKKCMLD